MAAVILMACLHGLLLMSILYFSVRLNTKANKFLALVLLEMSIVLGYEFSFYVEFGEHVPLIIHFFPYYLPSIIPVGLFYFVIFLIQPEHQLTRQEKLGFAAVALDVLIDLMYIPVYFFMENEESIEQAETFISYASQLIGLLSACILLPWALRRVNQYQQYLFSNYSTTSDRSLRWLQKFLIWMLGLSGIWLISFIQSVFGLYDAFASTYQILTFGIVMSLFWVGYFVMLQNSWFQIVPFKNNAEDIASSPDKLSTKTDIYHESLLTLMREKKLYEDVDLTLDQLSDRLQISSGYLSRIINEKEQKNFFEFINAYRIDAVKQKLLDADFKHYTIMGIALESGFKSKSTFNAVFKKFTGQTPSAYKRSHG